MAGAGHGCAVVDLAQARELRAGGRLLAEVERELLEVRSRVTALCAAGALFTRRGGRDGRRLLVAQEALLEARRLLVEVTGTGAVPAPRLAVTRERLLRWAREHRGRARQTLERTPFHAPPGRGTG
ncbi:MAG: hypothetical protein L0Y66_15695 [Myxococcaceae bacterium]|nr:hypothetical protein [Myxococcaceae bacterium]MCI0671939.1 hypothetical protein [Myxococcaceae bacterium]